MLFLPLLDKSWALPALSINKPKLISWGVLTLSGLALITLYPDKAIAAVSTLVFAAVPEEWFFRAYFLHQLQNTPSKLLGFVPHPNRQDYVGWGEQSDAQQIIKERFTFFSSNLFANILTSGLFALLHTPTQGWFGLLVFFPSLIYGWFYQRTKDLVLVILLHALSNIAFFIFW